MSDVKEDAQIVKTVENARYAVIKTGGKQYRVAVNDKVKLEKLPADAGDNFSITEVLALYDGEKLWVGKPHVESATVELEVLKQFRTRKVVVFKKKRRQNYRRTNTHRQEMTAVLVKSIHFAGESATGTKAPAKKAAAPKKAATPKDKGEAA